MVGEKMNNKVKLKRYNKKDVVQCYILLALPLIGLFVLQLYPMLWAMTKAFCFYDGIDANTKWTGLENFRQIFYDKTYWNSWLVTFKFALYKLPIEIPLALAVATLLNTKIRNKGFFRAIFYMPSMISVVIIGLIFSNLFGTFGFINAWLVKWGLIESGFNWFENEHSAMIVLIIGSIWNTFGVNVIYFVAAFANVPKELYERAEIDGATGVVKFFKITLPMIAPVLQTILLLSINGTLHTNEYIIALTGGAPGGRTYTVMSYLVTKFAPGFADSVVNIGYGCALSIITAVFMGAIAIIYTKLSDKFANSAY